MVSSGGKSDTILAGSGVLDFEGASEGRGEGEGCPRNHMVREISNPGIQKNIGVALFLD